MPRCKTECPLTEVWDKLYKGYCDNLASKPSKKIQAHGSFHVEIVGRVFSAASESCDSSRRDGAARKIGMLKRNLEGKAEASLQLPPFVQPTPLTGRLTRRKPLVIHLKLRV